jgi:hypothetical protein
MTEYAISTFCYGERYHNQANRLIESIDQVDEKPDIFIVTDNVDAILKRRNVFVKNVKEYNQDYLNYKNNYYDFDFSVKRFSLMYAYEAGYEKVILTDADVIPNYSLFNTESVMNTFIENTVGGQVTYNFYDEQRTCSMLGDRFKYYEKSFGREFDKDLLTEMVEDCIQYISLVGESRYSFLRTWNECIEIKDRDSLPNTPAGNIDEMCFSALYNNLKIANTSDRSINLLIANHEKWY